MKKTKNTHDLVTAGTQILVVTLLLDEVPVNIPTSATVKALLQGFGMSPITCLHTTDGANWAQGVVAVEIDSARADNLVAGDAKLEVRVGGKTWFADVQIAASEIPA